MNDIYISKTAIITGSSRGIGASTAEYFAKNKYNIVINYINDKESAQKLSSKLEELYKIKTLVIKCDVSKEEEVINLLNTTKETFDTIDILINNAGIAIDTTLEEKTVENFQKILNVNLIGTFLMCKHIGLYMQKQGFGSIVNISSTNGIDSYYTYSMDYDASKAGVISLTHNFANQFAPTIRVNCIAPGWVNTDMNKELGQYYIEEECKHILLGRFSNPEEIAKEIYHIAVESTYINDSIIKIDGGRC
jgi:3-oxoacyl-[acyl-carrier protein] reductase